MNVQAYLDLLQRPINCVLITVTPDSKPHATMMWRIYEAPYIWMSTLANSQKMKNIRHNPNVIILTVDPLIQYRYLEIRGVVELVFPDTDRNDIDRLCRFYLDKPFDPYLMPMVNAQADGYMTLKILPQQIITYEE